MSLSLDYGKSLYDWWGETSWAYAILMWIVMGGREDTLRKKTVEACNLSAGDTVLDLGCGNGRNLRHLQRRVGSTGKILALDYSEGMLKAAQTKGKLHRWKNIEYFRKDAATKSYARESLDGAVCTLALTAVPYHREAIEQVHHGLKRGKSFAVLDSKGFEGILSLFNPLLHWIFSYATNWDSNKDVIASLKNEFGAENVKVHSKYNAGSTYLVVATKK